MYLTFRTYLINQKKSSIQKCKILEIQKLKTLEKQILKILEIQKLKKTFNVKNTETKENLHKPHQQIQ